MRRFCCTCAYEGTDFHGWQSQPSRLAVQDILEEALEAIAKTFVRVHGCSRTDSGVHAREQLFHIDLDWNHGEAALRQAFQTKLPPTIVVSQVQEVDADFHARFSTKGKRYEYHFCLEVPSPFIQRYVWAVHQKLDLEKMKEGAALFVGEKNYRAFGAAHKQEAEENPIKHIWHCEISAQSPNRLVLAVEGSGFLYKMVRSMAGCLVEVGLGRLSLERLSEILAGEQRTKEVVTAPAQGLILDKIFY